jgi:hypothetical protein
LCERALSHLGNPAEMRVAITFQARKEVNMLSDPLAVTYNGSAKSLPRTSGSRLTSSFRTADGEFQVNTWGSRMTKDGRESVSIELVRRLPDPTPSDAFDAYRDIKNSFAVTYAFDRTRSEASVDLPRLRTALLALVDSTFEGRLISGER